MKKRWVAIVVVVCTVTLFFSILIGVQGRRDLVYASTSQLAKHNVAIVFGAGILNASTPSDALGDRLKVASELYHAGKAKSILVSGDNSSKDYSEPDVMRKTLVDKYKVPEDKIFVDYGGRRTYDTCIRAHDLWGVEHAILVSQEYHLPRAIWTCEKLGIESVGISASLQPYVYEAVYKRREILAIYKAFVDVRFWEPEYLGGEFVQDIDK
ncbi:YdcF family protein [Candidatus Uhrbacteria bacterium]|nr:YdcF family protein [Candidatus Uhrbacteria bacterium]